MAVEEAVEEATAVRATTAEEEVMEWAEDQAAEWWVAEEEEVVKEEVVVGLGKNAGRRGLGCTLKIINH